MQDVNSGALSCVVNLCSVSYMQKLIVEVGKKNIKGDLIDSCKESIKQMSAFC